LIISAKAIRGPPAKIYERLMLSPEAYNETVGQAFANAQKNNLGGLEFLAGIPGTLGGALAMNAGAHGKSIGNLVAQAKVIGYNNKIKLLKAREIKFGYRKSSLAKYVILGAVLKLIPRPKRAIQAEAEKYLALRKITQDYQYPSCGCFFKNPSGYSAGSLIDACGLKGKSFGRARVSQKHANFIINLGNAKAIDVLELIEIAKREVKNKFGVELEEEIQIIK